MNVKPTVFVIIKSTSMVGNNKIVPHVTGPGIMTTMEAPFVVLVRVPKKKSTRGQNQQGLHMISQQVRAEMQTLVSSLDPPGMNKIPLVVELFDAMVQNLDPDQLDVIPMSKLSDMWSFANLNLTGFMRYIQYYCGYIDLLNMGFMGSIDGGDIKLDVHKVVDWLMLSPQEEFAPGLDQDNIHMYFSGTKKLKTILEETRVTQE